MSKRFFDTEKFKNPWYRKLTLLQKVIWEYFLSACDHAGLIENFDIDLMSFQINEKIEKSDLEFLISENKIQFVNDETIFIPKFFSFQYKQINPENKVQASALKKLEKYNLTPSMGLDSPSQGVKEKEKEKEKDKDKDKDKEISSFGSFLLSKLKKAYPKSFQNSCEDEKYSCLSHVTGQNYDLDKLYGLILRENPHKDFAPSPKFILNLLPRAKINNPETENIPPETTESRKKGQQIARGIMEKYDKKRKKV